MVDIRNLFINVRQYGSKHGIWSVIQTYASEPIGKWTNTGCFYSVYGMKEHRIHVATVRSIDRLASDILCSYHDASQIRPYSLNRLKEIKTEILRVTLTKIKVFLNVIICRQTNFYRRFARGSCLIFQGLTSPEKILEPRYTSYVTPKRR